MQEDPRASNLELSVHKDVVISESTPARNSNRQIAAEELLQFNAIAQSNVFSAERH